MTTIRTRTGVCAWCGTAFVAPARGRVPTYCKTSHRIRAYEQRRMAAALAEAEQRTPTAQAAGRAERPGGVLGKGVRVTTSDASSAIAELRAAAARGAGTTPTRPSELRQSIADVAAAMRGVLAAAGLPEIEPDDAAWWSLVVPVSEALRRAEASVAASPRSSRSLQSALERLLSTAGALGDPEATASQRSSYAHLAVAVPGPAGFAAGIFETDTLGRYKLVYWAPDADTSTRTLAQLAGRPEGFRYRWEDKRVWEQLAHDMIVVACGWLTYPERLPPALGRTAAASLGEQLRRDLGSTSEWAVHAYDILKWLARTGSVTLIAPIPEATSVPHASG